jgi:hypothetical protein
VPGCHATLVPAPVLRIDMRLIELVTDTTRRGPITFQWYRGDEALSDGGRISGSQTALLTIGDVGLADAGEYHVVADTDCFSQTSRSADIRVSCDVDMNGDGFVNTSDVIVFLNLWVAGDDQADFNDDGTVNTIDFIAFLNDWAAGC